MKMASGPIDLPPLEFISPVVDVGLFRAMSPTKRSRLDDDLSGRDGAGSHRPCVLSRLFIAFTDSSETGL